MVICRSRRFPFVRPGLLAAIRCSGRRRSAARLRRCNCWSRAPAPARRMATTIASSPATLRAVLAPQHGQQSRARVDLAHAKRKARPSLQETVLFGGRGRVRGAPGAARTSECSLRWPTDPDRAAPGTLEGMSPATRGRESPDAGSGTAPARGAPAPTGRAAPRLNPTPTVRAASSPSSVAARRPRGGASPTMAGPSAPEPTSITATGAEHGFSCRMTQRACICHGPGSSVGSSSERSSTTVCDSSGERSNPRRRSPPIEDRAGSATLCSPIMNVNSIGNGGSKRIAVRQVVVLRTLGVVGQRHLDEERQSQDVFGRCPDADGQVLGALVHGGHATTSISPGFPPGAPRAPRRGVSSTDAHSTRRIRIAAPRAYRSDKATSGNSSSRSYRTAAAANRSSRTCAGSRTRA